MFLDQWYQNFKSKSSAWRALNFKPLLKLLAGFKITPNKVTVFRLFLGLPLLYCFYIGNLYAALAVYLFFWFLDLVDGALARYLNIQSDKGRFLDSVVDNFSYCLAILGFIYLQAAIVWLLAANILLELTAQLLATIKKRAGQPSDWLISVTPDLPYFKSIVHAALFLYIFNINIINPTVFGVNLILLFLAGWYFYKIINKQ